ncbi:MAG: hypothetical protein U1F83_02710 [Verrucomicrobiota bacterium]
MNCIFGTNYTNGALFTVTNDLPITTIASDRITFPIEAVSVGEEWSFSAIAMNFQHPRLRPALE